MHVRVCFHDNCFDGAASAALFTRFYRERINPGAEIGFRGMAHKTGEVFPRGTFDGDENAVVDFRYSSDPALTWWFDHHVSAFVRPEDEAHFRADRSGRKFFDPTARSCTRFLARTCAEHFGFDLAPHAELIHWAEIIDSAAFDSPQAAIELRDPALKLMTWAESNHDRARMEQLIRELAEARPLAAIAAEPWVAGPLAAVLEEHRRALEVFRAHTRTHGGVAFFDVADARLEAFNKFIPYYLYPEARFVVGVSQGASRSKVSVGSNPWLPRPAVNIAAICERYGGGGHPVVGAVSMPVSELARARAVAREIADELEGAVARGV
jgi:hypothetical protein